MDPCVLLKQRFGGTWDGAAPEIHGLLTIAGRTLKVELFWVKTTYSWQTCVFEGGECLAIFNAEDPVESAAHAIAQSL
jgi:hypothetical protein